MNWRALLLSAAGGNIIACAFMGSVQTMFIGGFLIALAGLADNLQTANKES